MWRVITASVEELEVALNELEADGFHVFSVLPVGSPEQLSNVPRERRTLAQRTTVAVVAHKPLLGEAQQSPDDGMSNRGRLEEAPTSRPSARAQPAKRVMG